jgi:hypothetical protein
MTRLRWCLLLSLALATPSLAAQFGDFELSGFGKFEYSFCDNCSPNLVNRSSYDPRGVLSQASPQNPNAPMLNQAGKPRNTGTPLTLEMLTVGYAHEFDNAISIMAKATGRERNSGPDIYGHFLMDAYVGIAYPKYGKVTAGVLSSRLWTRTDSFAYPLGLSTPWAESGAGYGVFPLAARYSTPTRELRVGKISLEVTYSTARVRWPINRLAIVNPPPRPQLLEFFAQYSNDRNLVELTHQSSYGGLQTAFPKGAFTGSIGNTDPANIARGGRNPTENVTVLEGTYYRSPKWWFTWGLKRSEWSGQQQQCDYSAQKNACFWDQPGFNYASDNAMHHAIEWDTFGGVAYHRNALWTYTTGFVRMNKAYTKTPTEWGQSNSANFINLGLYRKMPEIYRNLEFYAGLQTEIFGRQGPAPISMPSNTADGAVDPRVARRGDSLTIGANLKF